MLGRLISAHKTAAVMNKSGSDFTVIFTFASYHPTALESFRMRSFRHSFDRGALLLYSPAPMDQTNHRSKFGELEQALASVELLAAEIGNPHVLAAVQSASGTVREQLHAGLDAPSWQHEGGETPLSRWRRWIVTEMGVSGGNDSQKTNALARSLIDGSMASAILDDVEESGTRLSRDILKTASFPALLLAIREYDPTSGQSFAEFVKRKVTLCLRSLPSSSDEAVSLTPDIVLGALNASAYVFRSQKQVLGREGVTSNVDRQENFLAWARQEGIPGRTYHDCILAGMIRFAPALIRHVANEYPDVPQQHRSALVQSVSTGLFHSLLAFDPKPGDDFTGFMIERLTIPPKYLAVV